MRIKRLQTVYLLGVLLVALLASFKFFYLRPSDEMRYQKMVRKKALASSLQNSYSPTEQKRSKVRKEIWLSQEDLTLLNYSIESRESQLTLTPIQNKFDIVERLIGMQCWMQDKLSPDGQQMRYFVAEEGLYRYRSSQLLAREAMLSLYRLPGTDLPLQPLELEHSYLRGIAQNISLTFGGKIPEFKANSFKAILREPLAKPHGSEKSMILAPVERPGNARPIRIDGGLPKRAGEEMRSQQGPKGRFCTSWSLATGSRERGS